MGVPENYKQIHIAIPKQLYSMVKAMMPSHGELTGVIRQMLAHYILLRQQSSTNPLKEAAQNTFNQKEGEDATHGFVK